MTKVVILGATGFIGRAIFEEFSKENMFQVCGLSSKDVDLTDSKDVKSKLPPLIENSVLIMSAAITRNKESTLEAMMKNIQMDTNVADIFHNGAVRRIIFIGSTDVYGRRDLTLPIDENSPVNPTNYYGLSKLTNERIVSMACQQYKIPLTILRVGPVYGPKDPHRSPVQRIIQTIREGEKLKLFGTGDELRNFVYMGDIPTIIKEIILKKIQGTYNLTTLKGCTIKQIIRLVEQSLGLEPSIEFNGETVDESIQYSRSKLFDLNPQLQLTEIDQGIRKTLNYE